MMYSPASTSRRPRPPASLAKMRLSSSLSVTSRNSDQSGNSEVVTGSSPSLVSVMEERRRLDRPGTSDSLGDIGDVSLALDEEPESENRPDLQEPKTTIGLGLPSSLLLSHGLPTSDKAQPSPPPPYGRDLPDAGFVPSTSTSGESPPRPPPRLAGSGEGAGDEEESQEGKADAEERLRIRRATDAARAIGLDLDFGVSNSGGEDDSELEEDEEVLRQRLRSVRRRLRQRDKELLMAAQVADQALRQHEQVLSQLSPSLKNRLPQLLSLLAVPPSSRSQPPSRPSSRSASRTSKILSPPGSRFRHTSSQSITSIASILSPTFGRQSPAPSDNSPDRLRTMKMMGHQNHNYQRKASRPRAFHTTVSSPTQRYHQIQAEEAEQRIIALETALTEAQAGEENQRKAAARLRRDHDKLKRDLEWAEEKLAEGQSSMVAGHGIGVGRRSTRSTMHPRASSEISHERQMNDRPTSHEDRGRREDTEKVEEMVDDIPCDEENEWPAYNRPHGQQGSRTGHYAHRQTTSEDTNQTGSVRSDQSVPASAQDSRVFLEIKKSQRNPAVHQQSSDRLDREPEARSSITGGSSSRHIRKTRESSSLSFVETRRIRKPIPRSGFLSPPKRSSTHPHPFPSPNTPRLSVNSPPDSQPSTQGPRSRFLLSRTASTPSPARSLASIAASLAQSPGFTALAERMADMREFVEGSLGAADAGRMRSLGSELGSELGDWGSPIPHTHVSADRSPAGHRQEPGTGFTASNIESPSQDIDLPSTDDDSDEAAWVDEPDTLFSIDGDFDEGDTTIFNSPAALPPLVSAALSSLAAALAPDQSWGSSPISGEEEAGPSHSRLSSSTSQDTVMDTSLPRAGVTAAAGTYAGPRIQAGADEPVFRSGHVRRQSSPSPMSSHPGDDSLILHTGSIGLSDASGPSRAIPRPMSLQVDTSGQRVEQHGVEKGKGKGREVFKHQLGILPRPKVERSSSSQSSIALAHRRVSASAVPVVPTTLVARASSDGRRGDTDIDGDNTISDMTTSKGEIDADNAEPKSIPAKVIHDLIVWLVIILQLVEWIVVLGIRVRADLQNGRNGLMRDGMRRWAGRRRYYL